MRVGFFGTPQLAARYLEVLAQHHEVVGVVTQPDRRRGRSKQLHPPPVKEAAQRLGIDIMQPERGCCDDTCRLIKQRDPQVCLVVAYGQILPCANETACDFPEYINVHYSLLPRLRGAAPVQHAILQGFETTGVTVQHVVPELDAGDIILQRELAIEPTDTTASLLDKLTDLGVEAAVEALLLIEAGTAPATPQDHALATHAPSIQKAQGTIDWQQSAAQIDRQIRAFIPWPTAFTQLRGNPLKILRAEPEETCAHQEGVPGTVVEQHSERGVAVRCGRGCLWLLEVQPAGKRPMAVDEFVRGARLEIGARLG